MNSPTIETTSVRNMQTSQATIPGNDPPRMQLSLRSDYLQISFEITGADIWCVGWLDGFGHGANLLPGLCEDPNLTSMLHQSILTVTCNRPQDWLIVASACAHPAVAMCPNVQCSMAPVNKSKCLTLEGGSTSDFNQ